jgi:hypothetical protein
VIANLQRWRVGAATGLAVLTGAMLPASVSAAEAHAARTLKATDTAKLRKVSAAGSLLIEEGKATGTLPGKMRASVNVAATISGDFTISIHGVGTIEGHGEATPHGEGTYESFAGTVTVTRGTGRYAHARGQTKLYGTFDRESYALVIQTAGTLSY